MLVRSHTCTISISHTHVNTSSLLTHIRLLSRTRGTSRYLVPRADGTATKTWQMPRQIKKKKEFCCLQKLSPCLRNVILQRTRQTSRESLSETSQPQAGGSAPFFVSSYLPWLFPGDTEVFGRTSHKSRRRCEPGQSWNVLIACPRRPRKTTPQHLRLLAMSEPTTTAWDTPVKKSTCVLSSRKKILSTHLHLAVLTSF